MRNAMKKQKELFNLNTALIQTARDKAVEILKSFGNGMHKHSLVWRETQDLMMHLRMDGGAGLGELGF